ncbi:hypothetical protein A9Q84_09995 [Halobacteriovorax marinus]|uniref:HD-GYP domain-containing protein n=1 Tax=Halobacteriovorax marinus TaxID=97084 RepID=A0A1Y5F7F8_9BACT|nr:hypothetical protein A9Q84_09995 [Halobacteriovorax marinus]
MSAFDALKQNSLSFSLLPISIRELFFLTETPCDIFGMVDGLYKLILREHSFINSQVLRDLISRNHSTVFVQQDRRNDIITLQQNNLRTVTRSLSIGDAVEKGRKQLGLLTLNMSYLYDDPTDDETLSLQYQSVKNLCSFLYERPEIHEKLYHDYIKQKHHFIFAQPLLSSLFLVGILKMSHLYSFKEVESLFITSYFKDIGMSVIPTEKYDQRTLSDEERVLLNSHPKTSAQILQGRIQLSPAHFAIMENHHLFSLLTKDLHVPDTSKLDHKEAKMISGFETMVISITDVIAAMITPRPYRDATSLFDSLELAKVLMSDDYPGEFKLMVNYFKSVFFK